jgi:hypothetical protein
MEGEMDFGSKIRKALEAQLEHHIAEAVKSKDLAPHRPVVELEPESTEDAKESTSKLLAQGRHGLSILEKIENGASVPATDLDAFSRSCGSACPTAADYLDGLSVSSPEAQTERLRSALVEIELQIEELNRPPMQIRLPVDEEGMSEAQSLLMSLRRRVEDQ